MPDAPSPPAASPERRPKPRLIALLDRLSSGGEFVLTSREYDGYARPPSFGGSWSAGICPACGEHRSAGCLDVETAFRAMERGLLKGGKRGHVYTAADITERGRKVLDDWQPKEKPDAQD